MIISENKISKKKSLILFFLLSFLSLTAQIIYLRECLYLYEQSEYIISFFWLFWLGANGAGVFFAGKNLKLRSYYPGIYVLSLFVFFYALKLLKPLLLTAQNLNNLGTGLFFTALFLFIPSFLNGALFASFVNSFTKTSSITKFYLVEAIAFMLSGLITSLIIFLFSDVYIFFFVAILILVPVYYYFRDKKNLILLISAVLLIPAFYFVRDYSVKKAFPSYELEYSKNTKSGRIDHLKSSSMAHEFVLFQGESIDFVYHPEASEEAVFPGIAQTEKNPEILISGSNYFPLVEALYYTDYKKIDILVKDKLFHDIIREIMPSSIKSFINQDNVNIIYDSPHKYLENNNNKYDLVFRTEQNPAMLKNSFRYFPESIKTIKRNLKPDGSVVYLFSADAAFTGSVSAGIKGSVFATLKNFYEYQECLPLNHFGLMIASDKKLITDVDTICSILDKRKIPQYYFSPAGTGIRLSNAENMGIDKIKDYDKELKLSQPVIYMSGLADVISRYDVNAAGKIMTKAEKVYSDKSLYSIIVLIIVLTLFFILGRRKTLNTAVFHAGFAGLSYELMLIFLYQLFFGDIYLLIGVLIAVFMMGVSLGIIIFNKTSLRKSAIIAPASFVIASLSIILLMIWQNQVFVFTGMIMSGLNLGMMFSLASASVRKNDNKEKLNLYASDLLGSCFGNVLIPLLFIPLLGFWFPVWLIVAAGIIIYFFLYKNYSYK